MIEYRLFKPEQAEEVSLLIRRTYDEFVAPDYPDEGNRHFYSFISPDMLTERFSQPGHFIFTATENNRIVGVIAVRNDNHLALLFVDKASQGRGISRKLLKEVEKKITTEIGKTEVTVFSSPYAVPIYRSLGFRDEGEMQQKDGITFLPMKHSFYKR